MRTCFLQGDMTYINKSAWQNIVCDVYYRDVVILSEHVTSLFHQVEINRKKIIKCQKERNNI